MKVTVIGSGVCLPSKRRMSPGLHVSLEEESVLMDCGPDIMHGLITSGLRHQDISTILITHFHPDHTLGLPHLLFATRYELQRRYRDLRIVGPGGLKSILEKFRGIYPGWLEPKDYNLEVLEIEPGRHDFSGWSLGACPACHRPESLAYRVEAAGGSMVYTGDTAYSNRVVELTRHAGLLVAEASFPEEMAISSHLTPVLAGKMAEEAGVGKLLLTHLYPPCDEVDIRSQAAQEFKGEVIVAEDGMEIEVGLKKIE